MKPVNILSFRYDPKAKFGCKIQLVVDDLKLVDVLENAIPNESEVKVWREKKDALLLINDLKSSLRQSGKIDLLTCAGCGIPDDILLGGFQVTHEGDYVIWEVEPPGQGIYFYDSKPLRFKFHAPQYEKVLHEISKLENECSPNNGMRPDAAEPRR